MKNNKGINLIALVSMIVIMIILASIAINVSMKSYENALETKQAAERQQVVSAISSRFGAYSRNETANPLVGLVIPEENLGSIGDIYNYLINKFKTEYGKLITDDEINNQTQSKLIKKFVIDNYENDEIDVMTYTRILNYNDLLDLEIENTNKNAVYLVNYYSSDVVGPIN